MDRVTSPTSIAASGMRAQADRLRHISENIANADTPGYRRKLVSFDAEMDRGRPSGLVEASAPVCGAAAPCTSDSRTPRHGVSRNAGMNRRMEVSAP